ncbi:hypothetical protein BDW02DRAFT_583950 [Decorospora gaudefroyi]|uniref:Protein kinase domain-containing protein n=1 Tax=Decorospora gaudefroyi TaxID=184978 RepID=A0A6A5JXU9_9PLEO|nr:hypothetical protein BDW02DRAFT_583950 [Decorospora gaudefroyi]
MISGRGQQQFPVPQSAGLRSPVEQEPSIASAAPLRTVAIPSLSSPRAWASPDSIDATRPADLSDQPHPVREFVRSENLPMSPQLSSMDEPDDQQLHSHAKLGISGILEALGIESVQNAAMKYGITDLWLPLSKQMFRRLSTNASQTQTFLVLQEGHLHSGLLTWTYSDSEDQTPILLPQHCSLEDDVDIVVENRLLGEGAVGIVEEVTVLLERRSLVCVRKRIGRPKQLQAQQQIMAAFAREVDVMRRVDHRHCVRSVGSYTDMESVNILSLPVADMDLATLLDTRIGEDQWEILYR